MWSGLCNIVASKWRGAILTVWHSVFGLVKFVRDHCAARGFWNKFSRDVMPGHVSLAPSKCGRP